MMDICVKCQQHNHTLQWHETPKGFVCLGCYYNRRAEQTKIELKYTKTPNTHTHCAK